MRVSLSPYLEEEFIGSQIRAFATLPRVCVLSNSTSLTQKRKISLRDHSEQKAGTARALPTLEAACPPACLPPLVLAD